MPDRDAPPAGDQPATEAALLRALAARQPAAFPVAVVVAHPDDEAIGLGPLLRLLPDLMLVHVTDGAPRGGDDARRAGFATPAAYAAARQAELAACLRVAGVAPRCVMLGAADQEASTQMPALARKLAALLRETGARAVITHAYEGGHPDHDATSCIVQTACGLLPVAPVVIEIASYHAGPDGGWVIGRFLDGPGLVIPLDPAEQACKRAMFAAHASQARVLAEFPTDRAAFRASPGHDFTRPPHAGTLLYEAQNWGMTGARWRALAMAEAGPAQR